MGLLAQGWEKMKQLLQPSGRTLTWKWILSFIVLTAGTLWVMLTTQGPAAEIPYGFFVEQVRAANVTQVYRSDGEIGGSFARAIRWSSESNAPTAGADVIYPPGTYTRFTTRLPRALDDAQVMSLLAQHDVQVVAAPLPRPWFMVWLRNGLPIALTLAVAAWIVRLGSLQSKALRRSSSRPGALSSAAGIPYSRRHEPERLFS